MYKIFVAALFTMFFVFNANAQTYEDCKFVYGMIPADRTVEFNKFLNQISPKLVSHRVAIGQSGIIFSNIETYHLQFKTENEGKHAISLARKLYKNFDFIPLTCLLNEANEDDGDYADSNAPDVKNEFVITPVGTM